MKVHCGTIAVWEGNGAQEKDTDVIYGAGIGQLKQGVSVVDLLEVCLHETTGDAAPKHSENRYRCLMNGEI